MLIKFPRKRNDPVQQEIDNSVGIISKKQKQRRWASYAWGIALLCGVIAIMAVLVDMRSVLYKSQASEQPVLAIAEQLTPAKGQPSYEQQETLITRETYTGSCMCPDDLTASGQRCGKRSAFSRNGNKGYDCE